MQANELVGRSLRPRGKLHVVDGHLRLRLAERELVRIREDFRRDEELWNQFLDVRRRRIAASPTAAHVEKEAVRAIETAGLQGNVHGRVGFLTNQIMQDDAGRRVVAAIQKLLLLWKAVEITAKEESLGVRAVVRQTSD